MISLRTTNTDAITVENEWNFSTAPEMLMHTIHSYPAKFPAFIAQKAFDYAANEGVDVERVADVFCGCGTVALEAKLHNKAFWGCDINPVATLIARAKSKSYDRNMLGTYYEAIRVAFDNMTSNPENYSAANQRLQYWYSQDSYVNLYKLRSSILSVSMEEKYACAMLCLFSSILKVTSKWLTKSIKPQIDPKKKDIDVWTSFSLQYKKFSKSIEQINESAPSDADITIETVNFIDVETLPSIDMIISSPPYVTSYEYADLHQLSTLWLEYTEDYRVLRNGSIGSIYNSENYDVDLTSLNVIGHNVVKELIHNNANKANAKVRSVARYYYDMQCAIRQCGKMLNPNGMVLFVVGDTEYKGIKIKNSEHLIQCLLDEGFSDIKASKRRISNKLCTPYRDAIGRFSSDKSQRTIYHEEFIISGRK
jgi:methylase of polypeptide subunit release factors